MRGLRLYSTALGKPSRIYDERDENDDLLDARVHARSRFQSVDDPDRFALYAVHDLGAPPPLEPFGGDHHTLRVVREFRRVPLDASALALTLNGVQARPLGPAGKVVTVRVNPTNFKDYLSTP